MITIKNLTLRNFLSVGAVTQVVNFNRHELLLVLGENLDMGGEDSGQKNGAGKTSILNALSYALYGVAISDKKKIT
jgi:DNA repair exonuclease SbcCD ATPase subunit